VSIFVNFDCIFFPFVEMEHQEMKDEIFKKFTWKIENFSRLNTDELYSNPFVLGEYPWYLNPLEFLDIYFLFNENFIGYVEYAFFDTIYYIFIF